MSRFCTYWISRDVTLPVYSKLQSVQNREQKVQSGYFVIKKNFVVFFACLNFQREKKRLERGIPTYHADVTYDGILSMLCEYFMDYFYKSFPHTRLSHTCYTQLFLCQYQKTSSSPATAANVHQHLPVRVSSATSRCQTIQI